MLVVVLLVGVFLLWRLASSGCEWRRVRTEDSEGRRGGSEEPFLGDGNFLN